MQIVLKITLSTGREVNKFIATFAAADSFMNEWRSVYKDQVLRLDHINIPYSAVAYWEINILGE